MGIMEAKSQCFIRAAFLRERVQNQIFSASHLHLQDNIRIPAQKSSILYHIQRAQREARAFRKKMELPHSAGCSKSQKTRTIARQTSSAMRSCSTKNQNQIPFHAWK